MCDYEDFKFTCNHTSTKLLSYCHFARTDPYHQCFGVKVTKHTWFQSMLCPPCEAYRAACVAMGKMCDFIKDLHIYIHRESKISFPRLAACLFKMKEKQ
ncbi:uncharacterized protein RSE6_10289 [Rhynchosporium secalis]|uniref:Uncharacterized protein n=1 Tax=Rhynchosporium secalis TaxID=38038 RepID=A0A1E1MK22_RHYSE|nr:uncharacterized protein RSE6_10289 [Rhynchosporium secalis]